ncbi:MAG: hypothetical protein BECKG1743D_GA0114223_102661, partial [Candidatus Kentron sp. G]
RYPADVKCLGFLYLYVGRYPRNNASRNTKDCSELHDAIFAPVVTQGRNSGATAVDCEFPNSFLEQGCSFSWRKREIPQSDWGLPGKSALCRPGDRRSQGELNSPAS